jgi:hypothetical protein
MGLVPGFLISWVAPAIIGGMQLAYIIGRIANKKIKKLDVQEPVAESEQYSSEENTEEYNPEQ